MAPGHEIVGKVTKTGDHVTKFKVGDLAGTGCLVDSCRICKNCESGLEQYCTNGHSQTYNGLEQDHQTPTYGGYSNSIVVHEDFVLHMAVKFGVAFGAEVTVLSTSAAKEADAKKLGAHHFVVTKDAGQVKAVAGSFDFILDTVSAEHDFSMYLSLLATDGVYICVGVPATPAQIAAFSIIGGRKSLVGSMIGGLPETQEMLDYCAAHNIVCCGSSLAFHVNIPI